MIKLDRVKIKNYLTLRDIDFEMRDLNILIGANGSGKSNFIDVFCLLRDASIGSGNQAPLRNAINNRRGLAGLLWDRGSKSDEVRIELTLKCDTPEIFGATNTQYGFTLKKTDNWSIPYNIWKESFGKVEFPDPLATVENDWVDRRTFFSAGENRERAPFEVFRNVNGQAEPVPSISEDELDHPGEFIHVQKNDSRFYPYARRLGEYLSSWSVYDYFDTSSDSKMRGEMETGEGKKLDRGGENLPLILNRYWRVPKIKKQIRKALKDIYYGFSDLSFDFSIDAGKASLGWQEEGLSKNIPAYLLSDGILRFLCLAAVLCDPDPPPLICLDEPETGLHPQMFIVISDLIKEAAKKTQILITTHSPDFVSCFEPEDIVVSERGADNGTTLKRLSSHELEPWLKENVTIGTMWHRNIIGGNRW